jgi:hypothetical protein
LAFGVAGFAWSHLSGRTEIPIRFLAGGGLALSPEPYHACFTADGGFHPIPLSRNGIGKGLPAGETLGWRVQIGDVQTDQGFLSGWFAPESYRVAQAMISQHSSVKVIVPETPDGGPLRLSPGDVWEWGWQLNDTSEDNSLVLLAMADKPLDADELRSDLVEKFPKALGSEPGTEGLDVTAAANYLAAKAMGAAKFTVQTMEGISRCEP